ncbi:MAG TPA: hypothetical protein VF268_09090 [Gammaproteobacteria bacterium]
MKKEFVILLGLVLATGCTPEDQAGVGVNVEAEQQSFADVDTDSNGLISEDEALAHGALADNFDQADENRSGYVSRSEFENTLGSQTLQE